MHAGAPHIWAITMLSRNMVFTEPGKGRGMGVFKSLAHPLYKWTWGQLVKTEPVAPPAKLSPLQQIKVPAILFGVAAVVGTFYWVYKARNQLVNAFRHSLSKYLSANVSLPDQSIRETLRNTPGIRQGHRFGHTHGDSANERSAARQLIQEIVTLHGFEPFPIQPSKAEVKEGLVGSMEYFWPKDLQVSATGNESITERHVITMIDADYYRNDMNEILLLGRPMMLFTFTPSQAGKRSKEWSYYFTSDNEIHLNVVGGAKYHHKLWDYNIDTVSYFSWQWGIFPRHVHYLVDRRYISDDRTVVLFTPIGIFDGLKAIVSKMLFQSSSCLKRLEVVDGEFASFLVQDKGVEKLTVAHLGEATSANVTADKFERLLSVNQTCKSDLSIATTRSWEVAKDDAPLLTEYIRSCLGKRLKRVSISDNSVHNYQFNLSRYEPDAKHSLQQFMNPLIADCYAGDLTRANEEVAVRERVTKLQDEIKDVTADKFTLSCQDEFISFFPTNLHPVSYEEVRERQPRPSQRRIIDEAEVQGEEPNRINKVFLKKDAAPAVGPQRIISTVGGKDKIDWSRFQYAISAALKEMPWYAFGKSPLLTAEKVVLICDLADAINLSDFSKMDGRICEIVRAFERKLVLHMFDPMYHEEIIALLKTQYNLEGVTTMGVHFLCCFARMSGSPETSNHNSILSAFVAFLGFRMMTIDGTHVYQKHAAWGALGVYGGDDGVTADINNVCYIAAAKRMGAVLTTQVIYRGDLGVSFLSRMYSDEVWYGNPSSCCDIYRQARKIHVTRNLPPSISPETKLLEKCRGYYCSDRNTPIIGDLSTAVVHASELGTEFNPINDPYRVRSWASLVNFEDQYPNEPGPWMDALLNLALPQCDIEGLRLQIRTIQRLQPGTITPFLSLTVLQPPADLEYKLDCEVVVNGQVYDGRKDKGKEQVCISSTSPDVEDETERPLARGNKSGPSPPVKLTGKRISRQWLFSPGKEKKRIKDVKNILRTRHTVIFGHGISVKAAKKYESLMTSDVLSYGIHRSSKGNAYDSCQTVLIDDVIIVENTTDVLSCYLQDLSAAVCSAQEKALVLPPEPPELIPHVPNGVSPRGQASLERTGLPPHSYRSPFGTFGPNSGPLPENPMYKDKYILFDSPREKRSIPLLSHLMDSQCIILVDGATPDLIHYFDRYISDGLVYGIHSKTGYFSGRSFNSMNGNKLHIVTSHGTWVLVLHNKYLNVTYLNSLARRSRSSPPSSPEPRNSHLQSPSSDQPQIPHITPRDNANLVGSGLPLHDQGDLFLPETDVG